MGSSKWTFAEFTRYMNKKKSLLLFGGMAPGAGMTVAVPIINNSCTGCSNYMLIWEQTMPLSPCMRIHSLAQSNSRKAAEVREEELKVWNSWNQNAVAMLGPKLLSSFEPQLVPQGLCIAAGTGNQGMLYSMSSASMPLSRVIPFRSMGKAIVAAMCLVLEERGLLHLDDPVGLFLPSFDTPEKRTITLKMLLKHTSGIKADNDSPSLSNPDISMSAAADIIASYPLECTPESRFVYSNLGWQVIGAVIEAAASTSFGDVFHEFLATPLGMEQTAFYNWNSSNVMARNPNPGFGACGTSRDMCLFLQMLSRKGLAPNGSRILSEESIDKMMCERVPHDMFVSSEVGKELQSDLLSLAEEMFKADVIPPEMVRAIEDTLKIESVSYGLGLFTSMDPVRLCPVLYLFGSTGTVGLVALLHESDPVWILSSSLSRFTYHQAFPPMWLLRQLLDPLHYKQNLELER